MSGSSPAPRDPGLDRQALEALYLKLEKPLYNAVYRWVWNAQVAQEIVQEGFVRLWAMRARVRMDTVEPLIWRITLNRASKRYRAQRRWGWLPLVGDRASPSPAADDAMATREQGGQLRRAIEALPEPLRQVITLCTFSEMSYAEIAQVLEIPVGTVGSRKNKAVSALRLVMEGPDV